jgi:hypothetical protein
MRMPNPTDARAVERVILVNIKEGVSETQLDTVAHHGKELLGAIPGVEQVSFGIALHANASYYAMCGFVSMMEMHFKFTKHIPIMPRSVFRSGCPSLQMKFSLIT